MAFGQHLFISYAHLDNEREWVKRFHDLIGPLLKSRLGREPSIWRDKALQGNTVFADEIVQQISDTAVMLSVVSPRYVESDWCLREANTFCDAAQRSGGAVVDRQSRIFKVVMIPPDSQDPLPAPMRDTLGFDFFEMMEGEPLELDPRYGPELGVKLELRTAQLAGKISRLLKQLDGPTAAAAGTATGAAAAATGKPAVYLAECSHDRRDDREALRTELESRGYPVLPDRMLPPDEDGYRAEVARQLARCRLAIHLVGSGYGAVPAGPSEQSVVVLQNALAVQQAHAAGLQRVVSLPAGTQTSNPLQQAFITALHTDPETQFGADLITAELEKVKDAVKAALARIEAPPPPPPAAEPAVPGGDAAAGTAPGSVYVIFSQPDQKATAPLRKALGAQCRVLKPVFEGDAGEVRQANEAWLVACDTVLVYYGSGTEAWRASVDSELLKAVALRGGRPFRGVFTWLAEPGSADKDDLVDTGGPEVIDARGGFAEALLAPVLQSLRGAAHG